MLALIACAPAPADAWADAVSGELPLGEALDRCLDAGPQSDECAATVVRAHPEADSSSCATILDDRWRAECQFAAAEHRARAGDRWAALTGCGQAGDYYHECLYHLWTFELQRTAKGHGRAVDGLAAGRPVVAFWSQIETIGEDAETQIWRDWWYFAHAYNKPADLRTCATLPDEADRTRCEDGTRWYVRRAVTEEVVRPSTPAELQDRLCRGGPEAARTLLGELYLPDPALDEAARLALAEGCGKTQATVARPWNPVFRSRRQ